MDGKIFTRRLRICLSVSSLVLASHLVLASCEGRCTSSPKKKATCQSRHPFIEYPHKSVLCTVPYTMYNMGSIYLLLAHVDRVLYFF